MKETDDHKITQDGPSWSGELTLANGWAHYSGLAGDTSFHSHYPIQIVFSEKNVAQVMFQNGAALRSKYIVIPSKAHHQLLKSEKAIELLFIEPSLMTKEMEEVITLEDWLTYLRSAHQFIRDQRLLAALGKIESSLDTKITLERISKSAGMSKSLFTLLFRAQTGLPLRRYVLWRRLYHAIKAIGQGKNTTEAAQYAGFSDSAHFSRTMRKTFGVSPSGSVQRIKITVAESRYLLSP